MTEPHKRPYRYPQYKTADRVNNWREYGQSLRDCGDIMLWISQEAIAAWRAPMTGKRGAQPIYANIAMETALALRPALSPAPAANRELSWFNHETDGPGVTLPRSYHAIAPQCHRLESAQEGCDLLVVPALKDSGRYWEVPLKSYPRIEQGGVILSWANDRAAAQLLQNFVLGPDGKALLRQYGFFLPGE